MSNTRKKNYSKKRKTQTQRKSRASGATMEQIKQNRRRNKMIRNIRMGRIYRGGGQTGGGNFVSQFIGKPWTPDSLGNYFALSPKGVGTGVVPKFDDGRPLGSARYPTQLGPQLSKLGQAGGSRKRSRKDVRGGGFVNDFYDNAKYSLGKLTSRMEGINPPPNPNPYVQPISKNMV
jgi:hypothetical protein